MAPTSVDTSKWNKATPAAQYALDRLKEKYPASVLHKELIAYVLNASDREDSLLLKYLIRILAADKEIERDEKTDAWRYKPPHKARSPEGLLEEFQKNPDMKGIDFQALKKGWPDCEPAIDKLEAQHKIVVVRNKKDNSPKVIFSDDPALSASIDEDFAEIWSKTSLPQKDDIIRFLIQAKRTPAGQVAENKVVAKKKDKVRKNRQSAKQTNKHMASLFRDYSALRQKGK